MKTYLKRFLALALILVIAVVAVACNNDEEPQNTDGVVSIAVDDVSSIVLEGEFQSSIAQNAELDLDGKSLKVYLKESSEYLSYLLSEDAPSDMELLSDDDGSYISIPLTSSMIQGFSSEELGEEFVFDIVYLGNVISVTYNVIDVYVRTISYDYNGGKAQAVTYTDESGKNVTVKKEALSYNINEGIPCLIGASRDFYTFDGWYSGDRKFESIEVGFEENLSLVAKWIPIEYVISFETQYGIMKDVKFTAEGEDDVVLEAPKTDDNESNGLVFVGWFTDDTYTQKVETHSITDCRDVTYYAKWANMATVTLEGEYSARIRSGKDIDWSDAHLKVVILKSNKEEVKTVKLTDKAVTLPVASQEVGVHEDNIIYVLDTISYEIPISYETMTEDTFFIEYVLNGGEFVESSFVTYYDSNLGLEELPTPEKRAYDFLGWYSTNKFTGDPVVSVEMGKRSDLILYAKYEAHVYNISYYIGAGELEYAQEESVGTQEFLNSETILDEGGVGKALIEGVTLDGYHFISWHTAYPFTEENAINYIPEDSCSDLILYAELGKKAVSVSITSKATFDKSEGSYTFVAEVSPFDTYYKDVTYEIISNKDSAGAVINGNVLTAEYPGEIVVVAKADRGDAQVVSEPFTLKITDRKAPVEQIYIMPTENDRYIIKANDMIDLKIKTLPEDVDMDDKILTFAVDNDEIDATLNQTLQSSNILIDNSEKTLRITKSGIYGSFNLTAVLSGKKIVDGVEQDYSVETTVTFIIPEPIGDVAGLKSISSDGTYIITQDIDLGGDYWTPLFNHSGDSLSFDSAFSGYLDGNGNTIKNICIDTGAVDGLTLGLFGRINNGVIKNIVFDNATIATEGELEKVKYVGILAGAVKNSAIEAISVNGEIAVKGIDYVGGVVGYMYGEMTTVKVGTESNSLNIVATVNSATNPTHIGGIAGSFDGVLSDFSVSVELTVENVVSGGDIYAGGIAGRSLGQLSDIGSLTAKITVEEEGVPDLKKPETLNYYSANNVYAGLIGKSNSIFAGDESSPLSTSLNLVIDAYSTVYAGIIGETDKEISNLEFTTVIEVNKAKMLYVGGVAGKAFDGIYNVDGNFSINILSSDAIVMGGIAGEAYIIKDSTISLNGDVTSTSTKGTTSIGGASATATSIGGVNVQIGTLIISLSNDIAFGGVSAVATDCANAVAQITSLTITASGGSVGGLVGDSQGIDKSEVDITANIIIAKNIYYGTVSAKHQGNAGNIIAKGNVSVTIATASTAYVGAYGEITNAIINGDNSDYNQVITVISNKTENNVGGATIYAGGIAGKASAKQSGYIENIKANDIRFVVESVGKDKGTVILGGVVGDNSVEIKNTISAGTISVGSLLKASVGGFVGENTASIQGTSKISLIEISYAFIKDRKVGGFVGLNGSKGSITSSYSESSLKGASDGSDKTAYIGGFAGENDGTINACFVGSIDDKGNRVSGIVKIVENNNNSATDYVGGFVGYNNCGKISNAYTDAGLDSNTTTGGFVGLSVYDSKKGGGSISFAISAGELTGSSNTMGGFVYSATLEDNNLLDGNFTECLFVSDKFKNAMASSQLSFNEIVGMISSIIVREDNYKNFDDDIWSIQSNSLPVLKGFIE